MHRFRRVLLLLLSVVSSLALAGTVNYQYDDVGRLRSSTYTSNGMQKVYGLDAVGNRTSVVSAIETTPPTTPTNLLATSTTSNVVTLTWTASTDNVTVIGYRVERCIGNGCTGFAEIASPSSNGYIDDTVSGMVTYSYRVRAVDAGNNFSAYSNVAVVTPPDTIAPPTPTNFQVASYCPNLMLSWTASVDLGGSGLQGYKIYRGFYPADVGANPIATASTASFTDTTVSGWTHYTYRIKAYDGVGLESGTVELQLTSGDCFAPTAPTITSYSVLAGNTLVLNWSASTDTGGSGPAVYEVWRSCSGTDTELGVTTELTYTTPGQTTGTTCDYTVKGRDGAMNHSPASNAIQYTATTALAASVNSLTWKWYSQVGQSVSIQPAMIIVTASGGTAPYTYLWEKLSGDASTSALTPTASSTKFTATVGQYHLDYISTWRCKVTDSVGAVTYTPNVTVTFRKENLD